MGDRDDSDLVRSKRLERLGRPVQSQSTTTTDPGQVTDPSNVNSSGSGGNGKTQNHVVDLDLGQDQEMTDAPILLSKHESSSSAAAAAAVVQPKSTAKSAVKTPVPEDIESWEHEALSHVLGISLDPQTGAQTLVYLEGLAQELKDENQKLVLNRALLERAIWSRLTEVPLTESAFDYLFKCWAAAGRLVGLHGRNGVKNGSEQFQEQKLAVVNELKSFCANFAVICCTSDLTETGENTANFGDRLINLTLHAGPALYDFVRDMILHAEQQDMLADLLNPLLWYLRDGLNKVGYKGDYKSYFLVLESLLSLPTVTKIITSLASFRDESLQAITVSSNSFLGPYFNVSPLTSPGVLMNFANADVITPAEASRVSNDIQAELKVIQNRLFNITNLIIRGSVQSRTDLLKYFQDILDLNHKRTAMQVDNNTLTSDGFMMNVSYVLVKLCEPFSDIYGSKIGKIDLKYFQYDDNHLKIKDETMLGATGTESEEFYKENHLESVEKGGLNFVTQVYFLTVGYMQYGVWGSYQSLSRLRHTIDQSTSSLERLQAGLNNIGLAPPSAVQRLRDSLDRLKKQTTLAKAWKLSLEAVLHRSTQQMTPIIDFCLFHVVVLLRAMDPDQKFPCEGRFSSLNLPLPEKVPDFFANYPEYFVEAPINIWIEAVNHMPFILMNLSFPVATIPLVIFVVTVLRCSAYIKNPYLKSKLVELLFFGSVDFNNGQPGYFVAIFDTQKLCLEHLFHSLMSFYIEVERTGRSSQFYEKFNTRYFISQIIKTLWKNNVYRHKLELESQKDVDFFVQFVALLLNDLTYLLDESLTKLAEIHKLQRELAHVAMTDENQEIQEKRQTLSQTERQARSNMQLANQNVVLLRLFTSTARKAFVTPEIVDRLAAMLDYNLGALVGPKCRELKVENPEKYEFNPKQLLAQLMDVYVNLDKEEPFLRAVARDGRSFDVANFTRAKDIVSKWGLRPLGVIEEFVEFYQAAQKVKDEDEQGDLELGDIPDEFLDPLMFTLMEEPVTLPSSKVDIDLSTIKQHLLSDANDPFNRAPLKLEDVIPNHELKEKIEAFKKQKKQEYLEKQKQ